MTRRAAIDPPGTSAAEVLGTLVRHHLTAHEGSDYSHILLGRKYESDPRDWPLERLLLAQPSDAVMDQTIEQVLKSNSWFSNWHLYLLFWRWLKSHRPSPTPPTPPPTPVEAPAWENLIQLDQGATGHCVGFGWAGWGDSTPVMDTFENADGHIIYYEAKIIDGEPHAEDGSTVRSGALAMRKRGRLAAFAFAKDLAEIDAWIDTKGTVVMGTDWTDDMFRPDADGWIKTSGGVAGGHCYLMLDKLGDEDGYLFQNSWGMGWGQQGRFKMKSSDVAALLAERGEACCALELPH